ncbi:MAG: right-handed parallel beta-helix repeat-containing protein [Clostridia bacterium]|nr:right-handed parallel beta-helix repeat-containing protein [Clostridia bacterium]
MFVKFIILYMAVIAMTLGVEAAEAGESYTYPSGETQGEDGWYAMCAPEESNLWEYLPVYSGGNWWAGENNFQLGLLNRTTIHPGLYYDAVLAWEAPASGQITIQVPGGAVLNDSSAAQVPGDGVEFGIFYEDASGVKPVYPADGMAYIANGTAMEIPEQTLAVQQGALVLFRIGCGGNNYMDYDGTAMTPYIVYTEVSDTPAVSVPLLPLPPGEKYPVTTGTSVSPVEDNVQNITAEAFLASGSEQNGILTYPAGTYTLTGRLTIDKSYSGKILDMSGVTLLNTTVSVEASDIAIDSLCLLENDGAARDGILEISGSCVTLYNCHVQGGILSVGNGLTMDHCTAASGFAEISGTDVLIARSVLTDNMVFRVHNGTLYGNVFADGYVLRIEDGSDVSVIENIFPKDGMVTIANTAYVNLTGNTHPGGEIDEIDPAFWQCDTLEHKWGRNLYGDYRFDETACGADMDRIPDNHTERFADSVVREKIYYKKSWITPTAAIAAQSGSYTEAVIPCGVYENVSAITLMDENFFTVVAYGALFRFEKYTNSAVVIEGGSHIRLLGLTIDHMEVQNAQGTVQSVSGNTVIWKPDEGYGFDITDTTRFANNGMSEGFRAGENLPFADYTITDRTKNADGTFTLVFASDLQPGDRLTFRGLAAHVIDIRHNGHTLLEDITIWGGSGFGINGWEGNDLIGVTRCLIMPGPKPAGTTEERMLSTCDATHFSNMRVGPMLTDCRYSDMTDDGTNINGHYTLTSGYNKETRTFTCRDTFTVTTGTYHSQLSNIRPGDTLRILTTEGQLVGDTTAASDGSGNRVTIADDLDIPSDTVILQNLSACGNGFSIENCVVERIRSRGLLIKTGGIIRSCTIRDVRMAGILVKPESLDWPEFGFSTGLEIRNNHIIGAGYAAPTDNLYASICIEGDTRAGEGADFQLHRKIIIAGNCIEERKNNIALKISHAQDVTVRNNTFLARHSSVYAKPAEDPGAPMWILDSTNVELDGNTWPENAKPVKIQKSAVNVWGADIGVENNPPEIEVPETEAPETVQPEGETTVGAELVPETETSQTETNSAVWISAAAAVVVLMGAVVWILLRKRKR